VIQNLSYGRDDSGLVTSITSPFATESWTYQYDELDRLATATNGLNNPGNQSFQYDSIGRVIYNSKVGTYAYPSPGSPRPHAPFDVAGVSYSYDANGNLELGGGRTLTWDEENRLSAVDAGGAITSFTHGGAGERLKMTAGSVTSIYPFGDDFEITDGTVLKYLSVPGLGVVAKRVDGQTYWVHADPLGSINAITDSAGGTVLRRTYRPYGEQPSQVGGHEDPRGFIGQRTDASTGLTFLHARYYDSKVGLFLSPDPLGAVGGMSLYSYGGGNPVNFRDVSGLCDPSLCIYLNAPGGNGGFTDGTTVWGRRPGDWGWLYPIFELGRLFGLWGGDAGPLRTQEELEQEAAAQDAWNAQHPNTPVFSYAPTGYSSGTLQAAAAYENAAAAQAAHSPSTQAGGPQDAVPDPPPTSPTPAPRPGPVPVPRGPTAPPVVLEDGTTPVAPPGFQDVRLLDSRVGPPSQLPRLVPLEDQEYYHYSSHFSCAVENTHGLLQGIAVGLAAGRVHPALAVSIPIVSAIGIREICISCATHSDSAGRPAKCR
jgi:RHS repeat-associated protein